MKTLKQLKENINHKLKTHYATCVNAFNSFGNRKNTKGLVPYHNVSDFASAITDDDNNNKNEHKISKNEFLKHCNVEPKHLKILNNPDTEFLHNKERDSHIMYDQTRDIHHFYEHLD